MRDLLCNADSVLFDFDGPLCSLFAVHPAAVVAQRLHAITSDDLRRDGGGGRGGHHQHGQHPPRQRPQGREPARGSAPETRDGAHPADGADPADPADPGAVERTDDPHAVLRAAARRQPGSRLTRLLEAALTQEEVRAAATARPTPYAAGLVTALAARGRRLAVVTNNSPLAVASYLNIQRLSGYFHGQLHGRTGDPALLKPDPDCLHRALRATATPPHRALMIGDTPADLGAARAAGVPFLGYAPDRARAVRLQEAGARHITTSIGQILRAVTEPSLDTPPEPTPPPPSPPPAVD